MSYTKKKKYNKLDFRNSDIRQISLYLETIRNDFEYSTSDELADMDYDLTLLQFKLGDLVNDLRNYLKKENFEEKEGLLNGSFR